MPSVEKSPVSESDAPMVIGVLELGLELALVVGVVVLVLLEPLLLHAARAPTDSAAVPRTRARLERQGG
jgi:hypothetical protein